MVVHCASGAGRTGVLLAIDIGLQTLLKREPVIDILRIVSALRQDRMALIQTPQQYRYINQVCSCDMKKGTVYVLISLSILFCRLLQIWSKISELHRRCR